MDENSAQFDRYLNKKQVKQMTGWSASKLDGLIKEGAIRAYKEGTEKQSPVKVRESSIHEYMAKFEIKPVAD